MKSILIVLGSFLFFTAYANADATRTGKITGVKMFSSVFTMYLDKADKACAGNHNRIAIKADHPLFSAVVASALTAMTTGSSVEISYKDICTHNAYSWDFKHLFLKP